MAGDIRKEYIYNLLYWDPSFIRPMAHDPSSPPKFLVPETWAENLGRVPST